MRGNRKSKRILTITIHGDLRALYPHHISAAKSKHGLPPLAYANDPLVGTHFMRCHDKILL